MSTDSNGTLGTSFEPGAGVAGPRGQIAHPDSIAHTTRLQRRLYAVGEHAWCLVGNGLSNQTFVEAPEGLIVIDTGESIEEMTSALEEIRRVTQTPVAACIYSHFHYVNGTRALLGETVDGRLEIYGHDRIDLNRGRYSGEVGPRTSRGVVHQFGVLLPGEGPDALVNVGLGLFFRNPDHAPYTPGYLPAAHRIDAPQTFTIAGLEARLVPAPSDADDSITIHFPAYDLTVNNLLWPALFNVFAIRGEAYRDPRVVLDGLDHLLELAPQHLIGTHGPPLSGRAEIRAALLDYRDAIQFMWDQTVRGANRGLSLNELTSFVQLPERFQRSHFTRQFYGLVEHHVRQIHAGLFGWFDEDEANLLPVPAPERARRLIDGFGGVADVRAQVDAALAAGDFRWAIELASWLVRCERGADGRADAGTPEDRQRLAGALRGVARGTTSANLRNWCLTRALELDGSIDLSRFRTHRFRAEELAGEPPQQAVPVLRVLLDPARAEGLDREIRFEFDNGAAAGLHVRGCVAVPTSGADADLALSLDQATWIRLLTGKLRLTEAIASGAARCTGSRDELLRVLAVFDLPGFA
ncbi:MAG: alkyl sulfatase dimerization domain-containing protein [Pseudomonadales bacterium]